MKFHLSNNGRYGFKRCYEVFKSVESKLWRNEESVTKIISIEKTEKSTKIF